MTGDLGPGPSEIKDSEEAGRGLDSMYGTCLPKSVKLLMAKV